MATYAQNKKSYNEWKLRNPETIQRVNRKGAKTFYDKNRDAISKRRKEANATKREFKIFLNILIN